MTWIEDLARRADAVLPDYVSAYYHSNAGDGSCDREGIADWNAFRMRPSVLRDASAQSTATEVLGTPVAAPVLVAPMAQQVGARPEGEVLTARGAAKAGTLLGVSTNTGARFTDIAAEGAPWWYQVYVARNRDATRILVERAAAAEAKALILTVDTTPLGREVPAIDPRNWPAGPRKNRTANLTEAELDRFGSDTDMALDLTPDTIGWLADVSGLPVLCKGVLTARDARRCVDAGAEGIIVSTHGGRRLGTSVTSAFALPEILAEVGSEVEVHVDSGIRGGAQAAAAIALGAKAVHVGRPVMWGLAADGADGVATVLGNYQAELVTTLRQLGIGSIRDLGPADVVARGAARV
ncbi:4-hydroxymandelate oxidase [Kineococcus radiotolerans]|uniref:4-hydroxymandelate oxidase n=1 Tax=Kineococcus radiotolerans TaxID=131568 RepID=A0A7W4XZ29_KINRA|nr:alpha-hydroxy acid oxidase [Kineococcus radiotolerans]MBB2902880.1 4-hydroxymandelate oxidase [Kineococcus radiotolerans]